MEKGAKIVACVCIFSILFTGCYSSAMVEATGSANNEIYTDNIEYVITNDGTKYVFEFPATVVKNSIVGTSGNKQVSIPLADVSKVYVTKSNPVGTSFLVLGIVAVAAIVYVSVSYGGLFGALEDEVRK